MAIHKWKTLWKPWPYRWNRLKIKAVVSFFGEGTRQPAFVKERAL